MFPSNFYSPVENLDFPLFQQKGLTVHVKRDDMIHPFISGNKWRKLKYVLQAARDGNKNHLITFGGAWSNHLLATACAGAKFGFKTTAFVRGETVSNANLSLSKVFGMELIFTDRTTYKDKLALYNRYFEQDTQAYFIDEGGHGVDGARGCGEIFDELEQVYDHVFCACGTGTTLAGLHMGKTRKGLNTLLHGIPVLAGGDFIQQAVTELYPEAASHDIILHTDYHFGGYAKTTPELTDFINGFCAKTGILIEPVYTGKLFYGVFDLTSKDYFQRGENILIIHTGGLTGILGMHAQFENKK
ncbi:1-aminocyclopropane-1-carboxylate deaminase/D-cysteine desulfhydrase [Parapedobacter tibetensis]|uniref:1-aminocyclopropane-1-carboxylate deaminase/D-cysteine desulfhydrase n=1 Tax=Parapedobacter tibetensis TaxID=2972951 RepID=UPI00214DC75B|nr:pyridoxal-phosphate dependent enzyme [Parapedobacter tibetensis]